MQASYEDVSEQISHVHDYHLKHKLQKALDEAKQEADDICAQKYAVVEARDASIVDRFDEGAAAQADKNAEADETNKNLCDAALAEQGARFGEFIEESGAKFNDSQADDRETFWLNIQHTDSKFNEGKKAYYVRHESHTKTKSYRSSRYGHRYRKTSRYVTHKPFFFSDKDIDFELQPLLDGIDDSLNSFEGDINAMKSGLLDSASEDSKTFQAAINADSDLAEDSLQGLADSYLQELKDESQDRTDLLIANREDNEAALNALSEETIAEIKAIQKERRECFRNGYGNRYGGFGYGAFGGFGYGGFAGGYGGYGRYSNFAQVAEKPEADEEKYGALYGYQPVNLEELDLGYGEAGNYGYYENNQCDKQAFTDQIDALKQSFADAVSEIRDSYAAEIAAAQEDIAALTAEMNTRIANDFEETAASLVVDTNNNVAELVLGNENRRANFDADAHEALDAFLAEIKEAKWTINKWTDKKIEWVEAQFKSDHYHVESAVQKLNKWRASALAELARRSASARSIVDECTLALAKELNSLEEDLQAHGEATIAAFEAFGTAVVQQLRLDGELNQISFVAASNKQGRKMNEFLDDLSSKFDFAIQEEPYKPVGHIVLID